MEPTVIFIIISVIIIILLVLYIISKLGIETERDNLQKEIKELKDKSASDLASLQKTEDEQEASIKKVLEAEIATLKSPVDAIVSYTLSDNDKCDYSTSCTPLLTQKRQCLSEGKFGGKMCSSFDLTKTIPCTSICKLSGTLVNIENTDNKLIDTTVNVYINDNTSPLLTTVIPVKGQYNMNVELPSKNTVKKIKFTVEGGGMKILDSKLMAYNENLFPLKYEPYLDGIKKENRMQKEEPLKLMRSDDFKEISNAMQIKRLKDLDEYYKKNPDKSEKIDERTCTFRNGFAIAISKMIEEKFDGIVNYGTSQYIIYLSGEEVEIKRDNNGKLDLSKEALDTYGRK